MTRHSCFKKVEDVVCAFERSIKVKETEVGLLFFVK